MLALFTSHLYVYKTGKGVQKGIQAQKDIQQIVDLQVINTELQQQLNIVTRERMKFESELNRIILTTRKKALKYVEIAVKNNDVKQCYPNEWVRTRNNFASGKVQNDKPSRVSQTPTTATVKIRDEYRRISNRYRNYTNIIAELT